MLMITSLYLTVSIELRHFSPKDKALWDSAYDKFLEILKKKEVIEAKRKAYEKSIENRKKQEAQLKTIDAVNYKIGGQDMILYGSGAPSIAPFFIGQKYIDQTNRKIYFADRLTGSTSDWVALN